MKNNTAAEVFQLLRLADPSKIRVQLDKLEKADPELLQRLGKLLARSTRAVPKPWSVTEQPER